MTPETREFHAACALGLEPALEAELSGLGAAEIRVLRGGATFRGDLRLGYAANLWLRSALRVQELLFRAPLRNAAELHARVEAFPWEDYMGLGQTLAVDAALQDSFLTHSGLLALKVKDGVVDRFRRLSGRRPDVDTADPDLPLMALLKRDELSLYRNLSGPSLHKRGWRPIQVKSPLNESIAAGLLLLSGWDRKSPLVDPMCGSGTFVIEAALLAAERAPGLRRRFAFMRWPDFERRAWEALRSAAEGRALAALDFALEGADRHAGALSLAARGARAAGVERLVRFTHAAAAAFAPRVPPAVVFVNPPWGGRLGEGEELAASWRDLGNFLRERCPGARAFVLSGSPEPTRHLRLKAARRFALRDGPVDCRLLEYPIGPRREPAGP